MELRNVPIKIFKNMLFYNADEFIIGIIFCWELLLEASVNKEKNTLKKIELLKIIGKHLIS